MANQRSSKYVQESRVRWSGARRTVRSDLLEGQTMLGNVPSILRPSFGEDVRPFPLLDRAFDAVERALESLGVDDPATLRSPRPVEEALSPTALPSGTLVVLNASELRQAEVDLEETVKDERSGGSVFVTLPPESEVETRKRSLRELAVSTPTFCLTPTGTLPPGFSRLHAVLSTKDLEDYHVLLADTPGFRVAVVRRRLPSGGWIALWTGNERAIAEVGRVVRALALDAGADAPEAASPVPVLEGVDCPRDVWNQAADLRAYRVIREAELREIARQAALKGVAMRREREAKKRAAG